jgi:hypothetical protein
MASGSVSAERIVSRRAERPARVGSCAGRRDRRRHSQDEAGLSAAERVGQPQEMGGGSQAPAAWVAARKSPGGAAPAHQVAHEVAGFLVSVAVGGVEVEGQLVADDHVQLPAVAGVDLALAVVTSIR